MILSMRWLVDLTIKTIWLNRALADDMYICA